MSGPSLLVIALSPWHARSFSEAHAKTEKNTKHISAGPNGAHGCAGLLCSPCILAISSSCSVFVSLLSRHPAISVSSGLQFCFLCSLVLSSLFSGILLKAVRATDTSRVAPTYPQKPHSLKLFRFGRLSPQPLIAPKPL